MELKIENLVRSVVVLVVAMPVSLAMVNSLNTSTRLTQESASRNGRGELVEQMKTELTRNCLEWAFSKVDSKLEREAKTGIDDALGGQVKYSEVCNWVL